MRNKNVSTLDRYHQCPVCGRVEAFSIIVYMQDDFPCSSGCIGKISEYIVVPGYGTEAIMVSHCNLKDWGLT